MPAAPTSQSCCAPVVTACHASLRTVILVWMLVRMRRRERRARRILDAGWHLDAGDDWEIDMSEIK